MMVSGHELMDTTNETVTVNHMPV